MKPESLAFFKKNDIIWEVSQYGNGVFKVLDKEEDSESITLLVKDFLFEDTTYLRESKEYLSTFGGSEYFLLVRGEKEFK